MKKNIVLYAGITVITFLIATTTLNAQIVKFNKPVDGITNVILESYGKLVITQGNKNSLTIETNKQTEKNLIFKKEGNTLILQAKSNPWSVCFGLMKNSDVLTYYLTLKTINEIVNSGSGNISVKTDITSTNLQLALNNAGNIDLKNIKASNIKILSSGSGYINAKSINAMKKIQLTLKNAGYINLNTIDASNINISSLGSGYINAKSINIKTNAQLKLKNAGYIDLKNVNSKNVVLFNSGSGYVIIKSMTVNNHAQLSTVDTGSIKINHLNVDSLNSKVTGSGDIKLSGSGKSQITSVSGVGNYISPDFKTETANVDLIGSGNITVNVIKSIIISATGSGNLKVIGKPSVNTIDSSGSGSIKFDN